LHSAYPLLVYQLEIARYLNKQAAHPLNTAYPFNSISGSFSGESLEIKKQAVGKPASFPYPLRKRFSNIPDQSASSCLDEDNIRALLIHSMVQRAYRI